MLILILGFECVKMLSGGITEWKKSQKTETFEVGDDRMLYKYNPGPVTWQQAKEACEDMDAHLAVVTHPKTLGFIQKKFKEMQHDGYVWLGAEYKMGKMINFSIFSM